MHMIVAILEKHTISMDFLTQLQSKPSHIKASYALAFSAIVTGFIGIVWVSTLPARFSAVATTEIEEKTGVFSTFFDDMKTQFANVISTDTTELLELAPMDVLPSSENSDESDKNVKNVETESALGMLGATGPATTSDTSETQKLPTPSDVAIPIASVTEKRATTTTEEIIAVPIPKNTEPKQILIEAKHIPKKTIMIGTTTIQKVE